MVGPTFEGEARTALQEVFREACPWAVDHSQLLSRFLDRGGNPREADVLCYVEGDTLAPCVSLPVHGVRLVRVPDGVSVPPLSAVELPSTVRFSPTDATRCGPHKYFLGEAYSGQNPATMEAKVAQLESTVAHLRTRWEDQHPGSGGHVSDITQVVGAVALLFSAGDTPRRMALDAADALVIQDLAGVS
jgi:hypothetical protein